MIKSGENFLLISGVLEAKMWKRFTTIENDYYYQSDSYFDAVLFRPKQDVMFMGFGLTKQYENHDFTMKFSYKIGDEGEKSSVAEITMNSGMLNEEQMFLITLEQLGLENV